MNKLYFWGQRLTGLLLLFISVFVTIVNDGDATFAIVGVPVGLAVIFTRKTIIGGKTDVEY